MVKPDISQMLAERGIQTSAYEMLVNHGQRSGHLSREDVVDILPDVEYDEPLIDEVVRSISARGIQVNEPEDTDRLADIDIGEEAAVEPETSELAEPDDQAAEVAFPGGEVDDVLRMYLREATQVPLLNATEEVELAQRIELCRRAQEKLSQGVENSELERRLRQQIEEGRLAREHLIRANARLVVSVAKRYIGRGLPLSDLIQEGNIGLMRAIRNYDYRRGFKFSTYATWWIRQAVTRALADQGRTIRLPAYMSDQVVRLRRVQLDLQQRLGRTPTMEEIGEAMNLPVTRVSQLIESLSQPVSLEAPVSGDLEGDLGDLLEDVNAPNPEEAVMDLMDTAAVREQLSRLPPREREILELRFGLTGNEPMTLSDVGQRLGITRERARQLETQALERMRNPAAMERRRRGPEGKSERPE